MITIENTAVETIPTEDMNIMAALDIIDRFTQLNEASMTCVICTLIDTQSAKYGEDAVSIAERVKTLVQAVNASEGPYYIA